MPGVLFVALDFFRVYRIAIARTATVFSSDVATVRGDKGDTYKPVVMYNYSYDGMQYQASSVTPISMCLAGEDRAVMRRTPRRQRV